MKRSIVKTAKTKDEAINEALKEINKSINEVDIEVIEEESTGFLGLIGQKDAVVKISYDEDINEGIDSLMKEIEEDSKKELEKEFDLEDLSEKIEEENSFEDELDEKENFDEINESFKDLIEEDFEDEFTKDEIQAMIDALKPQMYEAAEALDFEKAAEIRDKIKELKEKKKEALV